MRRLAVAFVLVVAVAGAAAHTARADEDSATHYYVSLGDSLAAGTNASGVGVAFTNLGYADQLHAALSADDPKLDLVKLGCPGESTVSMRFGSQLPSVVGSCGPPRYYNVFLPLGDPVVNARINALNNLLASTFAAAGAPWPTSPARSPRPSASAPGRGSARTSTPIRTRPGTA
jgi:hypothetical protein